MFNVNHREKQTGFSLMEVMIVIAIIAILATLAIPSQTGRVTQKKVLEALDMVEPYKKKIEQYYKFHSGGFPQDNFAAGVPDADKIKGNYVRKVEVRDGVLHIHLGQKMPKPMHDKIISVRPVFVKDSPGSPVSWVCGYSKAPNGMMAAGTNLTDLQKAFLPGRCRI